MRTLVLASLVLSVACTGEEGDPLQDTVDVAASASSQTSGCGDIQVVVHDESATHALFLTVSDDLAWDAANAGQALSRTYALPDPAVSR